jgi:hypothetical protein
MSRQQTTERDHSTDEFEIIFLEEIAESGEESPLEVQVPLI